MTSSERRRCMYLLQRAKQGDELAAEALVKKLAENFAYMLRGYGSVDPAFDQDDLKAQFALSIWQYIDRVDGRGDPLYHLAWRGLQAVRSMLTIIKQRRHGSVHWVREYGEQRSVGSLPAGFDLPDPHPESDPEYVIQVHEDRDEAHQTMLRVTARVSLTARQQDVFQWLMTDPEPTAKGANQRLAQQLGVSEQAASVLRRKTIERLHTAATD